MEIRTRFDLIARLSHRCGLTAAAVRMKGRRLTTLCYHGITPRYARDDEFTITGHLSVALFRRQLEWLSDRMTFIDLEMLLGSLKGGRRLPRRAVLITFDDGFLNNIEHALPVLREFRIRPIFFIPSDPLDRADGLLWYERLCVVVGGSRASHLAMPEDPAKGRPLVTRSDRQRAYDTLFKQLASQPAQQRNAYLNQLEAMNPSDPMDEETRRLFFAHATWEMLARICPGEVDIGGHTTTHAALSHIPEGDARAEVARNFDRIRERIGLAPRAFAYPFGSRDFVGPRDEEIVKAVGYEAAFTLVPPFMEGDANRFALPRRNVNRVIFELFACFTSGLFDRPMKWRGT